MSDHNTGYAGGTKGADPVPVHEDYGFLEEAPIVEDDDYEPRPRGDEELYGQPPEEEPVAADPTEDEAA
jgi:hypothetical protein